MSSKRLFLANAAVTVPFGILALLAPSVTFGLFGLIEMEASTQTLVRGYAAAALGYGLAMYGLCDVSAAEPALLFASAVFNLAEFLLQGHAVYTEAGFNSMVWSTLLSHGILGVWSLRALASTRKQKSHGD